MMPSVLITAYALIMYSHKTFKQDNVNIAWIAECDDMRASEQSASGAETDTRMRPGGEG